MKKLRFSKLGIEIISLSTARARLLFFVIFSAIIYTLPISILAELSVWSHFGVHAPSIGLTRAYHYLLHGEFMAAQQQNRLINLILLVGIPLILKDAYTVIISLNKGKNYAERFN